MQPADTVRSQASQLSDYVDKHKIKREVDVVIVSPLSRALETAVGAFGGSEASTASGSILMQPLTHEEVWYKPSSHLATFLGWLMMTSSAMLQGRSPDHAAVSSEGSPPFVAWEVILLSNCVHSHRWHA